MKRLSYSGKKIFLSCLWMLALAALACKAVPVLNNPPGPGSVLFQDDFSDPSSGWDKVSKDEGEASYVNGEYRIFVNTPKTDVWSNPHLSFTDVRIEVDARKVGGVDNNDFGVICRYKNTRNFYELLVSSDGYYGIFKVKNGEQAPVGLTAMQPSDRIHQGETSNHIRADCVGDTLSLYVNGSKVGEVKDAEFKDGDIGLVAGAYDLAGTDIRFDRLRVLKPGK